MACRKTNSCGETQQKIARSSVCFTRADSAWITLPYARRIAQATTNYFSPTPAMGRNSSVGLHMRTGLMCTAKWLLLAGYLWDWLLALGLVIINFTIPCSELLPPLERMYFYNDPALSYPLKESWLSESQKFPVELGIPLLLVALLQFFSRSIVDWHHFALALLEAFAIESTFKKWMNLVGKPRPSWFAVLETGDPDKIREARTSYPSGHAAETFMAFGLLSLYLMAKLKLFTTQSQGHFAKVVLCLVPLGFAAFITMSRVAAYKHDFADVNAGMAIGLLSGILAYLINYECPFCGDRVSQPRLRPLAPAPSWLKRCLGEDAEHQCCRWQGRPAPAGAEEEQQQPLLVSESGAAAAVEVPQEQC